MRPCLRGRYYSQNEVDEMKDAYEAKLSRAYDIIDNLQIQLRDKKRENQKLEFYVETMAKTLMIVGDIMRETRR